MQEKDGPRQQTPKANSLALTHLRTAVARGVLAESANEDHISLILSRPAHKSSKIRRAFDFYIKASEPCYATFVNKALSITAKRCSSLFI
jgi:hypothetical protein